MSDAAGSTGNTGESVTDTGAVTADIGWGVSYRRSINEGLRSKSHATSEPKAVFRLLETYTSFLDQQPVDHDDALAATMHELQHQPGEHRERLINSGGVFQMSVRVRVSKNVTITLPFCSLFFRRLLR